MRTTKNDRRPPAAICRERGWGPGTRLAGDEGYGVTVIQVTAVGEQMILAKTLTHRGEVPPWAGQENSWTLACRDWQVAP